MLRADILDTYAEYLEELIMCLQRFDNSISETVIKTSNVEIGLQIARLYRNRTVTSDMSGDEQRKVILNTIVCFLLFIMCAVITTCFRWRIG